jgi:hypothetical protein
MVNMTKFTMRKERLGCRNVNNTVGFMPMDHAETLLFAKTSELDEIKNKYEESLVKCQTICTS